jgi:hypothetical protein
MRSAETPAFFLQQCPGKAEAKRVIWLIICTKNLQLNGNTNTLTQNFALSVARELIFKPCSMDAD